LQEVIVFEKWLLHVKSGVYYKAALWRLSRFLLHQKSEGFKKFGNM